MAYNKYNPGTHPSGLHMTDIPGNMSQPHIYRGGKNADSGSNSPNRYRANNGKNAEILSSDLVHANESKVRKQISHFNKSGVSGPFIGIDSSNSAPRSPQIPMGSSSYKMHFSPGKMRNQVPRKLLDSSTYAQPNPNSSGLRHISNGDAFTKHSYLNNSMDYSKRLNPDDFRIKKNLTSNADRILTSGDASKQLNSPMSPNKFEEIRKHAQNQLPAASNGYKSHNRLNESRTIDNFRGEENYNQNNIYQQINKPYSNSPAGTYNTTQLQRHMGMPISSQQHSQTIIPSALRQSMNVSKNVSMGNMNDPAHHRTKNYNSYGYDVLTGVRKDSPRRML